MFEVEKQMLQLGKKTSNQIKQIKAAICKKQGSSLERKDIRTDIFTDSSFILSSCLMQLRLLQR